MNLKGGIFVEIRKNFVKYFSFTGHDPKHKRVLQLMDTPEMWDRFKNCIGLDKVKAVITYDKVMKCFCYNSAIKYSNNRSTDSQASL